MPWSNFTVSACSWSYELAIGFIWLKWNLYRARACFNHVFYACITSVQGQAPGKCSLTTCWMSEPMAWRAGWDRRTICSWPGNCHSSPSWMGHGKHFTTHHQPLVLPETLTLCIEPPCKSTMFMVTVPQEWSLRAWGFPLCNGRVF